MQNSPLPQNSASPRALMPDYLRLIAVFGIVIVNIRFFAYPSFGNPDLQGLESLTDQIASVFVEGFATLKTYGLFSFMFGVGLAFQMQSAKRKNSDLGPIYTRRMIFLGSLGFLHGVFFFFGDILLIYAIAGSVLFFCRNLSVTRLIQLGSGMLLFSLLVSIVYLILPQEPDFELLAWELGFFQQAGFWELAMFRGELFALTFLLLLPLQGSAALGWFCLGLAAHKKGMIDRPSHKYWRFARFLTFPALSISLLGAFFLHFGEHYAPGNLMIGLSAPFATIGYLGWIAKLSQPVRSPFSKRLLNAGSASLTIYLGQSILLSFLFSGYGLGLYDMLNFFKAFVIAILATLILLVFTLAWQNQFSSSGPFEAAFRYFTHWARKKIPQ